MVGDPFYNPFEFFLNAFVLQMVLSLVPGCLIGGIVVMYLVFR